MEGFCCQGVFWMSFIPMLVVVAMVMGMGMKMGCLFVGVLLIHTVPTHPTALEDQKTRSTFDNRYSVPLGLLHTYRNIVYDQKRR